MLPKTLKVLVQWAVWSSDWYYYSEVICLHTNFNMVSTYIYIYMYIYIYIYVCMYKERERKRGKGWEREERNIYCR